MGADGDLAVHVCPVKNTSLKIWIPHQSGRKGRPLRCKVWSLKATEKLNMSDPFKRLEHTSPLQDDALGYIRYLKYRGQRAPPASIR